MSLQLPARRLREGRPVLAIPVGLGRNEIVLTKLRGLRTSPGFRVDADGVAERYLEGFFQEEGRLYLYGPWEPGATLEEVLEQGKALPCLRRLAQALVALGDRRPEELATDAVRFLEDGAVELLSPQVMRQARNIQPEEHRLRTFEAINHPDSRGLSYSLAALLYRLVAGEYPFAAGSGEETRRRARELRLAPLSLTRPGVREEVSAAVMDGLGRGLGKPPTLERWAALLQDWETGGLFRELPEAELRALAARARREQELASRAYRRRVFWQLAIRDGRTSTEIRRRHDVESGTMHEEEWVVLDKAGRLQLPKPYVEKLNLRERVKLRLEETHVTVWPQHKAEKFVQLEAAVAADLPIGVAPQLRPRRGPVVATQAIWRTFTLGAEQVHAVQDVSLAIPAGKMVVLKGRSGSGKTTLLNLVAGLDEPTQGIVAVGGKRLSKMTSRQRVELRRRHIGFIFQTFGLLPFLSVEENVGVPMRLVRAGGRERRQRVAELLRLVGLTGRARHRTYELSGGEQQRAAIARALVNRPYLILADEPTGQLDTATGTGIIQLLRDIVDRTGVTVIVASHDPLVWQVADMVFELRDGQLVSA